MSEVSLIDLSKYSVDLRLAPIQAAESQLYKGLDIDKNPIAVKIYKKIPISQIELYRDLTNSLAQRHKNDFIDLKFDGKVHHLLINIVPIERIGLTIDGMYPCTMSPFIEGRTLFGIDTHYISDRFSTLEDDPLVKLGQRFREETGFENISIIPWNIKPIPDGHPKILAITDIAGSIVQVKHK